MPPTAQREGECRSHFQSTALTGWGGERRGKGFEEATHNPIGKQCMGKHTPGHVQFKEHIPVRALFKIKKGCLLSAQTGLSGTHL